MSILPDLMLPSLDGYILNRDCGLEKIKLFILSFLVAIDQVRSPKRHLPTYSVVIEGDKILINGAKMPAINTV